MISVYGADWCGDCRRAKSLLTELGVEFEYLDVDANPDYKSRAVEISSKPNIPVVVFPDTNHLVEPSKSEIELKLRELNLLDHI